MQREKIQQRARATAWDASIHTWFSNAEFPHKHKF